ncbi:N-6 DNA Methylase [anaerobic digester metagenome]
MTVLEKTARTQLDKAVQAARRAATTGADRALRSIAVDQEKKPAYLTPEQAELRRRLRVKCRALGTWPDLVRAVAYEQWHRMLFARFLAENGLLIHPDYHASVTLDECAEIARGRGIDQWEVAAEYAAGMLPGIFQKDDPLLLLKYAPEDRAALQEILVGIPAETFRTQDALGWTYQFWQTEEKDRVNKSEKRIEGADICAVTQLFTEHYMVQFLLQNSLGAWWLSLHPDSRLRDNWLYYKDQVQHDFSSFPTTAKELKLLDPACGSGHFLVEAFHMLLAMRQEAGEARDEAIAGIVRDNLHGLEIDPRCIQIAGFAVAMEAWKTGFPTDQYLPLPNLACVGLPIRTEKAEWLKLAAGDGLLESELGEYYDLFRNADSLGSLIKIEERGRLTSADVLRQRLEAALAKEKAIGDPVAEAFGETASGVLKSAEYLRRKDFHIVVTNPPFLGLGNQSGWVQRYYEKQYPNAKNNLATCFIDRCRYFSKTNSIYSLVSIQNWLFLSYYRHSRADLINNQVCSVIVKLGPGAFETISGEVVIAALLLIYNKHPKPDSQIYCIDATTVVSPEEKSRYLLTDQGTHISQADQLKNPDNAIVLKKLSHYPELSTYAYVGYGSKPGQTSRVTRYFWEVSPIDSTYWMFMESSPDGVHDISGKSEICLSIEQIQRDGIVEFGIRGADAWGKMGIIFAKMNKLPAAIYLGQFYDDNTYTIIPNDPAKIPAFWAYIKSGCFYDDLRNVNQKLNVTRSLVQQIPFNLSHWQKVAEEQYPNGLPEPHSDDPTQWLYKGDITSSEQPLHVAIARLLGYRWPDQPADDTLDNLADKDGIVCIPPVWGERPAADWLRSYLGAAYGAEWSPRKEEELLRQAGFTKNSGLEGFLRDEFFASHCRLFHQRPFIWQVWDGTKDGFSVLLNYHKLDRNTLQKLIYTYLGTWITQQKDEVRQEKPGAERRLAAAEALKAKLELIAEGERPYDIYVRWKPLHEQAMGWEPDLNDGVRMNIRPFMEAGILRWKPNIKWGKDRGTDPIPNCSGTTERLNDLHFTLEEKRKARESKR